MGKRGAQKPTLVRGEGCPEKSTVFKKGDWRTLSQKLEGDPSISQAFLKHKETAKDPSLICSKNLSERIQTIKTNPKATKFRNLEFFS